ncbi:L-seryl-tRNA(Sec) selenium transferase [Helicobacter mastomyrinus]|uniref:L-seryl-tRNA(Sec) selenium transferase n=3 Tax=Helicobacter TaxID=209 RepID=A0ABZ3F7V3_9HELI|nr:L-seryl-tRNA(Sec) selenium transferase [uncultured Helicobacter sp.]
MKNLLQSIPKVDSLLQHNELKSFDKSLLLPLIASHLNALRTNLKAGHISRATFEESLLGLIPMLKKKAEALSRPTLRQVVNATGVVIHTNLGRSVLSQEILDEIMPFLRSYHTLEYDLDKGKRDERYRHCTQMLCEICGCEDALLVNNNASAVFLVLNTFGAQKETIISRGELVEIGGSFRIPEIMASAGSILCEVGTTNKTRLRDYENAINEQSAIIMKTHQSNFKQIGFVQSCEFKELTTLARKHHLIDYFDLGSGHIGVLNLPDEPSVQEICKYKPSLLSFSGDKLLGAGQVGIILGSSPLIATLKKNPLLRALRVDKFSILALNATLKAYKQKAYYKIPTLSMLQTDSKVLESRAQTLKNALNATPFASKFALLEVIPLQSLAGGGSIPHLSFDSFGVALCMKDMEVKALESALRRCGIIVCVQKDRILLDMRTLLNGDEEQILSALESILGETNAG